MNDLLDRLNRRRFPWLATTAYAGNIASAAYMPQRGVTVTVDTGKPDQDIDDAIARIGALEANLTELLRLYDWRAEVGSAITHAEAIKYGAEKKAAWIEARRLLTESPSGVARHQQGETK